jgi:hypothetical protein
VIKKTLAFMLEVVYMTGYYPRELVYVKGENRAACSDLLKILEEE